MTDHSSPDDMTERPPHEIMGPPRAYFEIPQEAAGNLRIIYRTLAGWYPTEELAKQWQEHIFDRIRKELWRTYPYTPIIWWRLQPQLAIDTDRRSPFTGNWFWRCRLETSPKLSDDFWKSIHAYMIEGRDPLLVLVPPPKEPT